MEEETLEESKKGPLKLILGLFLLLIMIAWLFPIYSVKLNPEPKNIPSIDKLSFLDIKIDNTQLKMDNYQINKKDPIIKSAADYIVTESCSSPSKLCSAKALYYFTRDNINYVSDPINLEYIEKPEQLFVKKSGDCESGSLLLANMLESVGIDAQLIIIFGHAYVSAILPEASITEKNNNYVYMDWTCNTCKFGQVPFSDYKEKIAVIDI